MKNIKVINKGNGFLLTAEVDSFGKQELMFNRIKPDLISYMADNHIGYVPHLKKYVQTVELY